MKALTPPGLARSRQVSPLAPLCRPNIPSPNTTWLRTSLCPSPQRLRSGLVRGPGFTQDPQARQSRPPNRVRCPTGCPFASGCFPPRLAATQLPSASCDVTSHGKDSHLADKASSRTHGPRLGGRGTAMCKRHGLAPRTTLCSGLEPGPRGASTCSEPEEIGATPMAPPRDCRPYGRNASTVTPQEQPPCPCRGRSQPLFPPAPRPTLCGAPWPKRDRLRRSPWHRRRPPSRACRCRCGR